MAPSRLVTFNGPDGVSTGLPVALMFGGSGNVFASPDGMTWVEHELELSMRLHDVARSEDRYVFVGADGLASSGLTSATPF